MSSKSILTISSHCSQIPITFASYGSFEDSYSWSNSRKTSQLLKARLLFMCQPTRRHYHWPVMISVHWSTWCWQCVAILMLMEIQMLQSLTYFHCECTVVVTCCSLILIFIFVSIVLSMQTYLDVFIYSVK